MSIFTKIIVDKVLDNYPKINKNYCLNTRQRRYKCTICQDLCRNGCISSPIDEKLDKKTCDDCSICVANCPTGAIIASKAFMEKTFNILNNKNNSIVLSCSMYDDHSDCSVDCLASYPWELIASIALTNKVYFSTGDCDTCEKKCDYSYMLDKTKGFLGEEKFNEQISFSVKPIEMTRLEAFNLVFKKSKNTVYSVIRNMTTIEDFDQIWRKLLVHNINEVYVNWDSPIFNNNCKACEVCAKVCPVNALHVFHEDKSYYMAHFTKKCRGCGLCEQVCPCNGINKIGLKKSNNSKAFVTQLDALHCVKCGKLTTSEDGICDRCNKK